MSIRRKKGVGLATLVVAGAVAMGSYAFTASNTVPSHSIGAGSQTSTGYTTSNIRWTSDSADLNNVDYVDFDVTPAADVVKIQVKSDNSDTPVLCDLGQNAFTDQSGSGTHTYTVDDPTNAGATTTVTAAADNGSGGSHAVCSLKSPWDGDAGATATGYPNASITKLTIYAEKKSA